MTSKGKGFFNLETTFEHAVNQLKEMDPEEVAVKAAVELIRGKNAYRIFFLNDYYLVNHSSGETLIESTGEKASVYTAIILLHYLITSDGTPLWGRWISFKELPGGQIYIEPFQKRAIEPLVKSFGAEPEKMVEGALSLGGYNYKEYGNYSMVIPTLPRVPVLFNIRPGDEEFPPSGVILFDANAHHYLPTEDYAHLPGVIIRAMMSK